MNPPSFLLQSQLPGGNMEYLMAKETFVSKGVILDMRGAS